VILRKRFLDEQQKLTRFEQTIMPHVDAAYNLARWLAGNESDAQDVVQDAYLRAFRFFAGFRGEDSRAWLLRIVRNAFYDSLKQKRRQDTSTEFDEQIHAIEESAEDLSGTVLEKADYELLHKTIAELPVEFREILVLRELEDFSYKQIAAMINAPLGTVMSRLARARSQLRSLLVKRLELP
jgi:RNA polymerase sigma-70 factor (ECF subfamily)